MPKLHVRTLRIKYLRLTLDKVLTANPSDRLWQLVPRNLFLALAGQVITFAFNVTISSPRNLFVISDQ